MDSGKTKHRSSSHTVVYFHPTVFTFINYPSNGIKTANGQEETPDSTEFSSKKLSFGTVF
jgi:hypothetical protein